MESWFDAELRGSKDGEKEGGSRKAILSMVETQGNGSREEGFRKK